MVQTKEDKERFFADLERLASSDTETESDGDDLLWDRKYQTLTEKQDTRSTATAVDKCIKPRSTSRPPRRLRSNSQLPVKKSEPVIIDLTSPDAMPTNNSLGFNRAVSPTRTSKKRSRTEQPKTVPNKRLKKSKEEIQMVPEDQQVFKDLVFFFIPTDTAGKARKLRVQRAQEYGARWAQAYDSTVTHVIVEERIEYAECAKAFPSRQIPDKAILVATRWFSESISALWLKDIKQSRFQLRGAPELSKVEHPLAPESTIVPSQSESLRYTKSPTGRPDFTSPSVNKEIEEMIAHVKQNGRLSPGLESDKTASFPSAVAETSFETCSADESQKSTKTQRKENKGFLCMESHNGRDDDNPNLKTIAILQEMATYYDRIKDHWRTTAYRKAIGALRKQDTLIATREQALAVPQIGERLADKIEEIVTTNRLRRLENTKTDTHDEILQLFMGIYGVGLTQATQWIAQGHRTLDDLVDNVDLSANQRVGIAHYEDFEQRIPRTEVSQHANIVRRACQAVDKDIQVIVGGSYRRGNADSGDIDLLVSKPNANMAHIRTLVTAHVVPALLKAGFLMCALAASGPNSSTGSKWHGASCLPNSTIWRRIDLLFVPGDEIGAALLYFTGNDIFNRSMRLLASKKGMRLNQHGLYKDVMRGEGRSKMTEGTLLEGQNEKRIFELLGVPWREPYERKC